MKMALLQISTRINNPSFWLNKCKWIFTPEAQNLRISVRCFNRKLNSNVMCENSAFTNQKQGNVKLLSRYLRRNICRSHRQIRTLTSLIGTRQYGLDLPELCLQKDNLFAIQSRQKSGARKRNKLSKSKSNAEDETDSEEEVEEESDEDEDDDTDDDDDVPKGYRDITAHVKSLRVDSVLAAGLNISKSKVDDFFLQSKLRLNSEKVLKKARKVTGGDELDLIHEHIDGGLKVKRVIVKKILNEKTGGDRFIVKLRTWRNPIEIDNNE